MFHLNINSVSVFNRLPGFKSDHFLKFYFLVKRDSLGNFVFIPQCHLEYPSKFQGFVMNKNSRLP